MPRPTLVSNVIRSAILNGGRHRVQDQGWKCSLLLLPLTNWRHDGGYAGQLIDWVEQSCGWVLDIVKRNADACGFEVLPKRWIVERTFAWFGWYRRLSKDYEQHTENSEAIILICMIHRMARHLKPAELANGWEK